MALLEKTRVQNFLKEAMLGKEDFVELHGYASIFSSNT